MKLSNHLDADAYRLRNLADAVEPADAVRLDRLYVTDHTAGMALSKGRAGRVAAGVAIYADAAAGSRSQIGVFVTDAAMGEPVRIQWGGIATDTGWAWTADLPVYVGTNGVLTQVLPGTGFAMSVGVALSATEIHVGARRSISDVQISLPIQDVAVGNPVVMSAGQGGLELIQDDVLDGGNF